MKSRAIVLGAIAAATIFTTAINARAGLLAYESFNYAAGSALPGSNGGTGFSGAYDGNAFTGPTVSAPGDTYTDGNGSRLAVAGNAGNYVGGNNGAFRGLSNVPTTVGTSLYVSFLMQLNTSTNYAGLSLFTGESTENLFLGRPGGSATFGIDTKSGTTVGAAGATPTTLSLLVYRLDFAATSANISLYVNPTLGTEPLAASVTATKTAALTFDTIRIQSGVDNGTIDEIRFGNTFADVTPIAAPEPASLVLVLLGGAGMFGVLRCRRA